MKIKLDPNALSFGDLEDFETAEGMGLMEAFGKLNQNDDGSLDITGLRMSAFVSLVWICGRATDPDFTRDDARKVRPDDLDMEAPDPPDPTQGSA